MRAVVVGLVALLSLVRPALAEDEEPVVPEANYPALAVTGVSPEAFVPQGWFIETKAAGDLNGDGLEDFALVLRDKDPKNLLTGGMYGETPFDTNPRLLAVVFADTAGGAYRLGLENHSLIPRPDNPSQEDPLSESGGVSIDHGSLKVGLYLFMSAGGWDMGVTSYRFRYEKDDFRLIGYDNYNVNRGSGRINDVSINLLTGKVVIKVGSISDDKDKTTVSTLKKNPVLRIGDVGDGSGFAPQY